MIASYVREMTLWGVTQKLGGRFNIRASAIGQLIRSAVKAELSESFHVNDQVFCSAKAIALEGVAMNKNRHLD